MLRSCGDRKGTAIAAAATVLLPSLTHSLSFPSNTYGRMSEVESAVEESSRPKLAMYLDTTRKAEQRKSCISMRYSK